MMTVTQAYEAIPGEIWEEVDKIASRNGNTHLEWAQSVDRLRCALAEHIHRHRTAASQASDAGQVEDIARKAMRKAEVDCEGLGDALGVLSHRLRMSGFLTSEANHAAYEKVVAEFQALASKKGSAHG